MLINLILLLLALLVVVKGADIAIKYSVKLTESFRLSKYVVGFLVVAVVSILPEGFISIAAAFQKVPAFGLGTLFGSNVADLTLVFALVVLLSGRNLKIESKIINNGFLYLSAMLLPIILGLNGHYSRWEGLVLVVVGIFFYFYILKNNQYGEDFKKEKFQVWNILFLLLGVGLLLAGSYFTVRFGVALAGNLGVNPVLVGMFMVALGTTLPELTFSLRAAKRKHDSLALGDILGTVMADATILVGAMAIINPFVFNRRIIYVSGVFMLVGAALLFQFMRTGKIITKKEALLLMFFYILFVSAEMNLGD